ncbi:hypothetical protein KBZ15_10040 [Cyanobium sp. BA20m-p-22]|uniref:hypothetical protein n=1 Tax=Cyanobium sp. BA20m-p-22 TaxID=2823704 RepID=UPI0020CD6DAF|nr:hypothetical protein [Cyanobium sp. BA20m-p-22]MCP9910243.1 hypothetical protein [Cyanobium sp. BA20m-p-22]
MAAVSFSAAAAHLGHRSRSTLYRLKDAGLLGDHLRPGGKGGAQLLELQPEGLPTLRDWVRGILREQTNSPTANLPPAPAAGSGAAAEGPDPAAVAQGLAQLVAGLPEDAIPALNVSKERKEHYLAELARLEALQRRGELLPATEVRHEAMATARMVRDQLLAMPHRIASQLAAEMDARACHRLLDSEINQALLGLCRQLEGLEQQGAAADG